jgi:Flp pilus assembly protein TadD
MTAVPEEFNQPQGPAAPVPPVTPSNAALPAGMPGVAAPPPVPIRVSMAEAVRLATEHFEKGRKPQAESVALEILANDPEQPDALHICGALAHLAGKNGLALALLEKAARLQPANAQVHYNLGVVLQAIKREDEASESYRAALKLRPGHPGALQNLGNIAMFRENFAEAERCYRTALAAAPNSAVLLLSLGMLYCAQRRLNEAAPYYRQALALMPDSPQVRWEAGQFALLCGDLKNGWQLYEARFPAGHQCKVWRYPFPFPEWRGEPLAGKHLLVHGEQGLGDEIMFLSIVPQLMAEGARITIVGQPHLHSLWSHVFPNARCYQQLRANEDAWTKVVPAWMPELTESNRPDYQIPFGSLALWRRSSPEDFKHQRAYITAAPEKRVQWAKFLDDSIGARTPEKRRIGLVWAGNPAPNNMIANRKDARRSIGLAALAKLANVPGIDWVSLQTWEAAQQVRDMAQHITILDCSARLTSFAETAALIDNLDAVISVDTSVCHLASAMGKPVFLLLPHAGEWRWGLDPHKSLWWPSIRLFRQPAAGDWASVVAQLREALMRWKIESTVTQPPRPQ